MNIRFYGGKVLTFLNGGNLEPVEVWTQNDKIIYVGDRKETDIHFDREIDLDGDVLLPGFKNAHTHSAMTFLRSFADDMPLQDWLTKQVFPMEAKLTAEDVYTLTKLGIMEYLTSGITANFDMYYFRDAIAKAAIDTGFRTVLCGAINDYGGTVDDIEEDYNKFNSINELVSYQIGFHAEYTTSEPLLKEISELAHKKKAPVYTHLSETAKEVEECFDRHGMTPPMYLDSIGMFDYGGGGFHCVHMSDDDLKLFKDKQLYAVSNPGSNVKLASGIAQLARMSKMGIPLSLGTDGPASNNALDMFREMYLATVLQKVSCKDASAMDAYKVLEMACVGGAKAMQLPECDSIAEGKKADLCVISLKHPNMQPENNIVKNIIYSGSKQNVRMTMVNGKILYEDGGFYIGESSESIYKNANAIIKRMTN